MHNRSHAPRSHSHSHFWIAGLLGVAAGLILLLYVPTLPGVSGIVLLFGGFHVVGGAVLLASLYITAGSRISWLRNRRKDDTKFDFGWARGWMHGPGLSVIVLAAAAVAIEAAAPAYWPLALISTLLAASFFAGHLFVRNSGNYAHAVLPMTDLPAEEGCLILDAGCGAGRTSLSLGRALKQVRIVALDRFDSSYIEDGGRSLLERNLRLAGLSERVQIETGDLTALPFPNQHFDGAVSAHAMDHLGPNTEQGLREILRVLKPGGRFLLIVWIPGWTMFAIASVLAFFLASKQSWRDLVAKAGFELRDEGMFNGFWFVVLAKPHS